MLENFDFRAFSIKDIHRAVLSGEMCFRELAEYTVNATKRHQERWFPWVCFSESLLKDGSGVADAVVANGGSLRSLEGIPFGIKDIYNTIDFPTQMGSDLWKGFEPGNDARVVHRARESGGIPCGKTVTAEFAVHALNETLNPHDCLRTPGTSSSGSAVAVSLGIVPMTLGSQTAGSIIRPASFCGVYGFKPTFGTLPRTGTLKTTDSLDSLGVFTGVLEDMRRVFDAIRVRGRNYPYVNRLLEDPALQKVSGRPRIGLFRTYTWDNAEQYAKHKLMQWLEEIGKDGFDVVEVSLPPEFSEIHEIHEKIYSFSLAYYFKSEFGRRDGLSDSMQNLILYGEKVSVSEYHDALMQQEVLVEEFDRCLRDVDCGVSLSTAGSAPLRGVVEKRDPSLIWTFLHLPSMNVPLFVDDCGLPFGCQMFGARYRDYRLLSVLEALKSRGLIPVGAFPYPSCSV